MRGPHPSAIQRQRVRPPRFRAGGSGMSIDSLEIKVNACTESDIYSHLTACDQGFNPPLSSRVDISEYSRKLRLNALTFEAWSEGTLVGLVAAYIDARDKFGFITNTSVLAASSGRGIAARLLAACLE